jgi:hypothetical protein
MSEPVPPPKKPPYYWVDKWGNGYWSPRKAQMHAAGFKTVACGKDGPEAQAVAWKWVKRWQDHKAGNVLVPRESWPEGSLGEAFARFRATAEWSRKEPTTRDDWERGWRYIKSAFGAYDPKTVTLEAISL